MKKLFILLFDQLETSGSENIDSFAGGLWAAHRLADLILATNKELQLGFSVLLGSIDKNLCHA